MYGSRLFSLSLSSLHTTQYNTYLILMNLFFERFPPLTVLRITERVSAFEKIIELMHNSLGIAHKGNFGTFAVAYLFS